MGCRLLIHTAIKKDRRGYLRPIVVGLQVPPDQGYEAWGIKQDTFLSIYMKPICLLQLGHV